MRLNYQNSSNFGHYTAFSWLQQLHEYLGNLTVNFYVKVNSYAKTLLIAFGTGYKRVSLYINSRVTYATGEVSNQEDKGLYSNQESTMGRDGRGSVVPTLLVGKEPKHFMSSLKGQIRSYTTRSRTKDLAPVQEQAVEIPKGLQILAKH